MESTNLNISWGRRLRRMREERGLSQSAIASKAGVDSSWYARIERGDVGSRGVGDVVRIRLALAFEVQVADLFPYPDTITGQERSCPSVANAEGGDSSPTPATTAAPRSRARSVEGPGESGREENPGNE